MGDSFYRNFHYLPAPKFLLCVSFWCFLLLRVNIISSTGEKRIGEKPESVCGTKQLSRIILCSVAQHDQIVFLGTAYKCLLIGKSLLDVGKELNY